MGQCGSIGYYIAPRREYVRQDNQGLSDRLLGETLGAFLLSVPARRIRRNRLLVDNFVDKQRVSYGALWISLWITIASVGLTLTNGLAIVIPQLSHPA